VVKFVFSHLKLTKQPFFTEIFEIQGSKPPPSDAHTSNVSSRTGKGADRRKRGWREFLHNVENLFWKIAMFVCTCFVGESKEYL